MLTSSFLTFIVSQVLMFGASVILSRQADYLLDDVLKVWGQVRSMNDQLEDQCARFHF